MANDFDAVSVYISHIDQPYGGCYADTVGRFQEGFLRDGVESDLDAAFERAVVVAEKLIEAIKIKAAA